MSEVREERWSPAAFFRRWLGIGPESGIEPPDGEVPATIGRYRVVGKLGEGGMGTVYEAEDEVLGRRVALKRLKATDENARLRFWREARAAARLSHPNVCQLYEVGEDGGGPFLAMELLAGEPLSARLTRGPLPPEEAVAMGVGLLSALEALHAAGVVHRDLKPSNVFLTRHGCRILDFGLARTLPSGIAEAIDARADLTGPDVLVGSPRYMAPEQILGRDADARTDLFATGAVLYEALCGHPAFGGRTALEALSSTLHDPPLPLPPALACFDPLLRRALAKDPGERFATASERATALRAAAPPSERSATAELPRPWPALAEAGRWPSEGRELLVGRERELAVLEQALSAAIAGAGSVVFVTGERGCGKTALVGELLRRARHAATPLTVVAGRCIESRGPGEAFLPFLDALGRLLSSRGGEIAVRLIRTWAPTVAVQMPGALIPDPEGELHRQTAGATRERLIREGGDFMEAASRQFPVLLLLEDLQWADPASVEMLSHFGRRIPRQRILLVGTMRPSDVDAGNALLKTCVLDLRSSGLGRELPLPPLAARDVTAWLDARFSPNAFPPELASALDARCEGHPLFLRSLLELLAERGQIRQAEGRWRLAGDVAGLDLEPSKDLKDLVRAHLDTLSEEDRRALSLASVAGKSFLGPVVAALDEAADLAMEQRLLRLSRIHRVLERVGEEELPDGGLGSRYRFAHTLYHDVLYEDLPAPLRVQLHDRVARKLQSWVEAAPLLATVIAEHYERAREPLMAARLRTRAGDNAARRFAAPDAEEQYACALRLLEKLPAPERGPLSTALRGRLGSVKHTLSEFDEAAAEFEAMLGGARATGSADFEFQALNGLANALFYAQRVPESALRAREALDAADRLGSEPARAEARCRMAQTLICNGRLEEASETLDALIDFSRHSGSAAALHMGLGYRGFIHYWRSEYALAESLLLEAASLAEELGDGFELLFLRMFAALSATNLGRMSEALAEFERTAAVAERNGDRFWRPRLISQQGMIHRELLALEEARSLDQAALEAARQAPSAWAPEADALLNLCLDDVRGPQADRAPRLLADLELMARGSRWFAWMNELRLASTRAEYFLARGEPRTAIAAADQLLDLGRRLTARTYVCSAERVRAEAALALDAGLAEAAERLSAARDEFERHPAPIEGWKSGRVLGRLQRRLGNEDAAHLAFLSAARDLAALVAGTHDRRLREGFLAAPAVAEVLHEAGRPLATA